MSSVAVLGGATGTGMSLAQGLSDAGSVVAVVDAALFDSPGVNSRAAVACDFASAAHVAEALEKARALLGTLDAVVDARVPVAATVPAPLADLDGTTWAQRAQEPMRRTLHGLQAAYRALCPNGGAIVLVLPTLAMTGASGMVPWTTASEGSRSLAKAAARAWGPEGVRVNCVALPAGMLAGGGAPLDRPGLSEPVLGP
ncbi:MAG TPA: SDR family oxidoreductase, partial [Acidimicrobiales bacterium]|nr:SDR family oxidoreductase [Acidimicrobiales bacterium]